MVSLFATPVFAEPNTVAGPDPAASEQNQLLWGDTHLHTNNSFDAFLNRNMTADPATAYRYAKGLPVIHPYHRARVQIETPLDFLVVADHAEYLGVIRHIVETGIPREGLGLIDRIIAWRAQDLIRDAIENNEGGAFFTSLLPDTQDVETAAANPPNAAIPNYQIMQRTTWQEAIQLADAHNQPGTFTALIGWEWSSIPAGANLHRVVFTSSDASLASQYQPWSSADSMYPEDLWAWLDETSKQTGAEFVAIPHNSNISKGYMFAETSLRGEPIGPEYAQTRARWEPVVEATQIKGDSETHPDVSPDDPFADFETYTHYIQQQPPPYKAGAGDYVRSALLRGLAIEEKIGFNPYRFGLIGSTDAHTGIPSAEEPNFWGKMARDSTPETKQTTWRGDGGPNGWTMSASGLAAVWAPENSRSAILEAFRRKEVYATTGPRIVVRVFGGWGFGAADAEAPQLAEVGYAGGVPMGADLPAREGGGAPRFLVHAAKDPKSAHLDRVQMVKGWIDAAGATHEHVHDLVWSGDRVANASGSVPTVGNTVDTETGTYTNDIGAPTLAAVWEDPDFDPAQNAFYYVRVLEIPTPRHSVGDALALGLDPKEIEGPWWIQERAYTSPIWYRATP
ncbi:MAG: DUF3604 domain-containing protein [Deltaproteobacteria bacterium]|nr:DUF3604 domain-containing protein [Deltaproteobacteria bacterium]